MPLTVTVHREEEDGTPIVGELVRQRYDTAPIWHTTTRTALSDGGHREARTDNNGMASFSLWTKEEISPTTANPIIDVAGFSFTGPLTYAMGSGPFDVFDLVNRTDIYQWKLLKGGQAATAIAIQGAGSTVGYVGDYDPARNYTPGNIVTFGGYSWIATAPSTGNTPSLTQTTPTWAIFSPPGDATKIISGLPTININDYMKRTAWSTADQSRVVCQATTTVDSTNAGTSVLFTLATPIDATTTILAPGVNLMLDLGGANAEQVAVTAVAAAVNNQFLTFRAVPTKFHSGTYNIGFGDITNAAVQDASPAIRAGLAFLDSVGGGTLYFPRGSYLWLDQITIPNDQHASPTTPTVAEPAQRPFHLTGDGPTLGPKTGALPGTQWIMRWQNPNGDPAHGAAFAGGKLNSMGAGSLVIDRVGFYADVKNDCTPFVWVTNTITTIEDFSVNTATATQPGGATDTIPGGGIKVRHPLWGGQSSKMDAFVLGAWPGSSALANAYTGNLNSNFAGYGSVIRRGSYNAIRRALVAGTFTNTIGFETNNINGGGNVDTPFGTCIDFADSNSQCWVTNNQVEEGFYNSGIRLNGNAIHLDGNGWWDPGVSDNLNNTDIAPAGRLLADSTGTSLVTDTYYLSQSSLAISNNQCTALAADYTQGQAQPTVLTVTSNPGGTIIPGVLLRTLERNGDNRPGALQEWFRVLSVTAQGDGTYSISVDHAPNATHTAGTVVQVIELSLSGAVLNSGASTIMVPHLMGGRLAAGHMLHFANIDKSGKRRTGNDEWFLANAVTPNGHAVTSGGTAYVTGDAVTAASTSGAGTGLTATVATVASGAITDVLLTSGGSGYVVGNTIALSNAHSGTGAVLTVTAVNGIGAVRTGYTVTLDHGALWRHNLPTAGGGPFSATVTASTSTLVTLSSTTSIQTGYPITIDGMVTYVTAINANNRITVSPPLPNLPTIGAAVSQIVQWNCALIPMEPIKLTSEPVAALATTLTAQVNGVVNGSYSPVISVSSTTRSDGSSIAPGDVIGLIATSNNAPGQNVTTRLPSSVGSDWAVVTNVDGNLVTLSRAPFNLHGTASTSVLVGPFTYTVPVTQPHAKGVGVQQTSIAAATYLPKTSECGWVYTVGTVTTEPIAVLSISSRRGTTTTLTAPAVSHATTLALAEVAGIIPSRQIRLYDPAQSSAPGGQGYGIANELIVVSSTYTGGTTSQTGSTTTTLKIPNGVIASMGITAGTVLAIYTDAREARGTVQSVTPGVSPALDTVTLTAPLPLTPNAGDAITLTGPGTVPVQPNTWWAYGAGSVAQIGPFNLLTWPVLTQRNGAESVQAVYGVVNLARRAGHTIIQNSVQPQQPLDPDGLSVSINGQSSALSNFPGVLRAQGPVGVGILSHRPTDTDYTNQLYQATPQDGDILLDNGNGTFTGRVNGSWQPLSQTKNANTQFSGDSTQGQTPAVIVKSGSGKQVPARVQGATGQTSHLLDLVDSSQNVLASFDNSGNLQTGLVTGTYAVTQADYSHTILAQVPRMYYRLDETSGAVANDSSGMHGATSSNALYVGALTLAQAGATADGDAAVLLSGGRVDTAALQSLDTSMMPQTTTFASGNPFAVSMWVYPTSASGTQTLFSQNIANRRRFTYNDYGSKFAACFSSDSTKDLVTTKLYGTNQWYHVAYSFDPVGLNNGGTALEAIYVNGVQVAARAAGWDVSQPPSIAALIHFGTNSNTNTSPFNGRMDEAAIWNRGLAPTEPNAQYLSGFFVAPSALLDMGASAPVGTPFSGNGLRIRTGSTSGGVTTWTDRWVVDNLGVLQTGVIPGSRIQNAPQAGTAGLTATGTDATVINALLTALRGLGLVQ